MVVNNCVHNCESSGGGRGEVCAVVDNEAQCVPICLGKKEGENLACWRNASLGPDAKYYSVIDTCAKDESGVLYAVTWKNTACPGGCTDGVCDSVPEPQKCSKNCDKNGGRAETCVLIDNEERCMPICLGTKEGENLACYRNASLGPDAKYYSVIDMCEKDVSGTLYSTNSAMIECSETCTNGACDSSPVTDKCSKNCEKEGGRAETCVIIDDEARCMPKCLGKSEGENLACWHDASLGPNAKYYSVVDTCAKDALGTLFATNSAMIECSETCTNGACDTAPVTQKCSKNCDKDGGRAETCVVIDNEEQCRNKCLGTAVGENLACYHNASLGPNAKYFSAIDTCEIDELGTLYSTNSVMTECSGTCTEGKCD